jgi:hypothetical protein
MKEKRLLRCWFPPQKPAARDRVRDGQHLHRYAAEFDFRYNHRVANGVDDEGEARSRCGVRRASALLIKGLIRKLSKKP